jgi:glycine/D-amino acid oxidase-like deaminating enzyme
MSGVSFTTLTIDIPVYLNYLHSKFISGGGTIVRGSVQHISQVIEGGAEIFSGCPPNGLGSSPDAVVVCVGIGARALGGVEDRNVFPVRGQTVLLKAPWVTFGVSLSRIDDVTYIIPRKSGSVRCSFSHYALTKR